MSDLPATAPKLVVLLYRIQDRVAAEMWRESRGLF